MDFRLMEVTLYIYEELGQNMPIRRNYALDKKDSGKIKKCDFWVDICLPDDV